MQLSPYIFRGYDIRGIVDQEITDEVMYLIGRGFATFLTERRIRLCSVGRDNRQSSTSFSKAFIRGLNDGGIDTIDIGLSLSQIVYFSSYHFLSKACAMITASHNPKNFNGLKLGIGYSKTMSGTEIQELRQIIESGRFSIGYGRSLSQNIFLPYQKHLQQYFKLKKKWRVVVDTLNTSSGCFYPQIFRKAGCNVITLHERLDSHFPNGTDPTDTKVLTDLGKKVVREKADIGFAFDADGDRMAVVDENGKLHWMDIIVALFAIDILENIPGATIIYNNLCSKSVSETIHRLGGNPLMWKTGHSFIKAKIQETGAMLGGELSGHIFFMDNFFGHDDAAYACLRLLSFLEKHGETLSEATSSFESYLGSPEIKLGVADEIKFTLVEKQLRHDLSTSWPDAKINDLDGIRIDSEEMMAVVRASQNGPYITVRFEGRSEKLYNEVRDKLKRILTAYPEIDWQDSINGYALNNKNELS